MGSHQVAVEVPGLLVRHEKTAANYLGLVKVACILIWYRRQHHLSLSR